MSGLIKSIVIYIVIYSLGFLSGMKYHGQDGATALHRDLTDKVNYTIDKGKTVINKMSKDTKQEVEVMGD